MAPAAFVWSRQAPTPFPSPTNRQILSCLFSRSITCRPRSLAARLPRRGGFLRPSGRLYVAEPLAQGPHQYVMELFHDETVVRKAAADALSQFARPRFATDGVATYAEMRRYPDFETFAERMIANMRFNGYSREAVLAPAVRRRFDETYAANGGKFDQPVRIDCFGPAG